MTPAHRIVIYLNDRPGGLRIIEHAPSGSRTIREGDTYDPDSFVAEHLAASAAALDTVKQILSHLTP